MSNTDDLNLTADEQFFFDHAGWSHDPLTESPREGRARCARELAAAEQWAREQGYTVEWEDDPDGRYDHGRDRSEPSPETCEVATLWKPDEFDPDGAPSVFAMVASVGCVDDADDATRRVIAAELASEAMAGVLNG